MRRERRKRNSFTDMMIVIFVVLVCFGLTIYGIVYLTGKIFGAEERTDNITVSTDPVVTDPEEGDIIVYTDEPETFDNRTANTNINNKPPNAIIENPAPPMVVIKDEQEKETPKTEVPAPKKDTKPNKPEIKNEEVNKPIIKNKETQIASLEKGGFIVQIMAVKSQSAAEAEAIKYRTICPDVVVIKADLGEKGVWYRIRCGTDRTKTEAETIKNRLIQSFRVNPSVIPNK